MPTQHYTQERMLYTVYIFFIEKIVTPLTHAGSISEGFVSSADHQGARGAPSNRAQLHQQLRLQPFRLVGRRAAVTSPQSGSSIRL